MSKIAAFAEQPQTSAATARCASAGSRAELLRSRLQSRLRLLLTRPAWGMQLTAANNGSDERTTAATSDASGNQSARTSQFDAAAPKPRQKRRYRSTRETGHHHEPSGSEPFAREGLRQSPGSAATAKAPSSELLEVPEDFADDQIVVGVHPTYPKQAVAQKKVHGTVVLKPSSASRARWILCNWFPATLCSRRPLPMQ